MKSITALIAAGLLSSQAAIAQDMFEGNWYAVPHIGIMHADSDLEADNINPALGIRLGKTLNERWDVQLGLTHAEADEDSRRYSGDEFRQTLLGVDALYFFSRDRLRPFVLAGLGLAHNKIDYQGVAPVADADGSRTSWMANVGVGAQYDFTDRFGLQADLRHVYSRARGDGGLFGSDSSENVGNTYLNVGLVYRFGAPKQVAAAEPEPMPVAAPEPEPVVEPPPEPAPAPAPAPEPEPEPVGPDEPAFARVNIQAEVLFDFDRAELKPEGRQTLDSQVVEKMQANPQVELLLITGHADRLGTEGYNQQLSERRAVAVRQYLIDKGIASERLHTVGKGETEPVVECAGPKSRKLIRCLQPNRRVVLEIEAQRATPK